MALQTGLIHLSGTVSGLTFYQMKGVWYVRSKTSLDKKRFRRDPRFARSRERATQFGVASKIAKEVYYQLPKEERKHGVIGKLTGRANSLLQEGKTKEAVLLHLQRQWGLPTQAEPPATITEQRSHLSSVNGQPSTPSPWQVTPSGELVINNADPLSNKTDDS